MAATGDAYDYVIVGAGAAGCVLANRLTEDSDVSVLLIEAGGWDQSLWIHIPLGVGRIAQRRLFDWGYAAEPQVGRHRMDFPRGKVIGGTSSINSMTYVRGNRSDYDRWAANGLPDWSYGRVLSHFKRQESWEGGETAFRGGNGPVRVQRSRYSDPLVDAYLAAAQDYGLPFNDDYNAERQDGVALIQSTISHGRRVSAASAYLRPALRRRNLAVSVDTQVTRVVLHGRRAMGVEYVSRRGRQFVRAAREVILCGGAINSPQLLLLSGIGAPGELSSYDIAIKADLPGVGKNLQDHVGANVSYVRKGPGPLQRNLRLDRIALALARAEVFGTGFAADVPSRWMAFVTTPLSSGQPDVQLLFRAGAADAHPYLPPFSSPQADEFTCRAVVLRPKSRGSITLASANPLAAPIIHQNILARDADLATLRSGLRIAKELSSKPAVRSFVERERWPGLHMTSDADVDQYISRTAVTTNHPVGTCKMGQESDPTAVVDQRMRVHSVEGLRVIDASVMPDLVGGNIIAAIYMIAEKGADLIRDR
jgi:choline dehydrogenase-like flavoprotein